MELSILNPFFCWLDDNEETLRVASKALSLLNSPRCKSVFRILNKRDKISCNEILLLGADDKLEETAVYGCLKKLEKLDFVCAEAGKVRVKRRTPIMKGQYVDEETGEQVFSLNRKELSNFIDLINGSKIVPRREGGMTFEMEYVSPVASSVHTLDYDVLKDINGKVKCLCSKKLDFLDKLMAANGPLADVHFESKQDIQTTISRKLKQLAKCNLITRNPNKNFNDNSLKREEIIAIVTLLKDISYLNFNHSTNPRRTIIYDINGISFRLRK